LQLVQVLQSLSSHLASLFLLLVRETPAVAKFVASRTTAMLEAIMLNLMDAILVNLSAKHVITTHKIFLMMDLTFARPEARLEAQVLDKFLRTDRSGRETWYKRL
jgi:hypothetical protein